jgi:hypothetical protein
MKRRRKLILPWLVLVVMAGIGLAQDRTLDLGDVGRFRSAREALTEAGGEAPIWKLDDQFPRDCFTFARLKYTVDGTHGYGHTLYRWAIDFPYSDLNFSFRLQQVTSLKVNPDGRNIALTDKELYDYPFICIVEPGRLTFKAEEVPILRKYLLNGGFLMFDDFWGDREWSAFHEEIKKVFPESKYEPVDLPIEHPIFHTVFDIKEKPQVPNVLQGTRSQYTGITYEYHGPGSEEVHYRGISDDKGRLMVMICHNTDLGDGWEMEGKNEYFFREFSEKKAYPLGINIIVYAMTH